ncbi:MAG: cytochrome b5 [Deferribacterales bacterium]
MKREEVKQYNGENGKPAYIIYDGKVYDVSDSRLWKNGKHMGRHKAGEDLTDFISMAPHDARVLEKVKYVCDLEDDIKEDNKMERYRALYRKYHPHPIFIHYPMGILYFGALMIVFALMFDNNNFELSSYYALVVGTISIFPAVITGMISWVINYEKTMTHIFRNKLIFSFILIIISLIVMSIRVYIGAGILNTPFKWIYVGGYIIIIPVMTFIAYNGGRITWPD